MTLAQLLHDQDGVVSRAQCRALGLRDHDLARKLRRREWARILSGVYVEHTGVPTWQQRAWAAVLHYWPAALCHASALVDGPADGVIHVAVEHPRKVTAVPGVRVHRLVDLSARVRWNASPPRLLVDEAVLDVCATARDRTSALAVLAEVCRSRRSTPARLLESLRRRSRQPQRAWLTHVLEDLAAGTCSVLEHGYLVRIERAHGLPRGRRQRQERTVDGVVYRDVTYDAQRLVVELDGRLGHERFHERADDLDRDLLAAANRLMTIRLGWRQVEQRPCRTAARLVALLRLRGWTGAPRSCGPGCVLA